MIRKALKQGLRQVWLSLRHVTGDDAYERYIAHQQIAHAGEAPLSRQQFFMKRQDEKWSKVSRCC